MKRRKFLTSSVLLAGMPMLSTSMAQAFPSENIETLAQETATDEVADPEAFKYWTRLSRRVEPYRTKRNVEPTQTAGAAVESSARANTAMMGGRSENKADVRLAGELLGGFQEIDTSPIADAKKPTFVLYTREHGFRDVSEVSDNELIEKGDVNVTVMVNTLRPSRNDVSLLENAVGGSLKLDFGQKEAPPLPPLQNALAWSSIGVFAATAAGKKLPKLDSLKLDAST